MIAASCDTGRALYFSTVSAGNFSFNDEQLKIMFVLATLIPGVLFGLMSLVLFFFYPLSKKRTDALQEEKEAALASSNSETR